MMGYNDALYSLPNNDGKPTIITKDNTIKKKANSISETMPSGTNKRNKTPDSN